MGHIDKITTFCKEQYRKHSTNAVIYCLSTTLSQVKIQKSLFLLLGVAVFIPISGCSQFAGVSKNCDELAQKYLKTRFENAAANNEGPPTQIAVVESSKSVDVDRNTYIDGAEPEPRFTKHDLINLKTYNINQSGKISVFRFTVLDGNGYPTAPEVASDNQIVCRYTFIGGQAKYGYNSENQTYSMRRADYEGGYGTNIKVSEDKDNLYWKEGF